MDTRASQTRNASAKAKAKQKQPRHNSDAAHRPSKARGLEKDSPEVRMSKTLSFLLRHHAANEGVPMRPDGYVKVPDLLANPRLRGLNCDFPMLKEIVATNAKQRFALLHEPDPSQPENEDAGEWLIRANQGHSIKTIKLDMREIVSSKDIATGLAVHGTTKRVWPIIERKGLSKMSRNHIHLAQTLANKGSISGMRNNCDIFIYIDVDKAVAAGIKFYISENGVLLSEGNEAGFLPPDFFMRVEDREGVLPGWEGRQSSIDGAIDGVNSLTV